MENHYLITAFGVGCGLCIGWMLRSRVQRSHLAKVTEDLTDKVSGVFSDTGDYKMVFVIRNDLKMGKGKVAAQCCHAAVGLYRKSQRYNMPTLRTWENIGQAKVCLKADTEESLIDLSKKAGDMGLVTTLIRDAGRTQIAAGSTTVLGIGPAPASLIDQVTGHLKLY